MWVRMGKSRYMCGRRWLCVQQGMLLQFPAQYSFAGDVDKAKQHHPEANLYNSEDTGSSTAFEYVRRLLDKQLQSSAQQFFIKVSNSFIELACCADFSRRCLRLDFSYLAVVCKLSQVRCLRQAHAVKSRCNINVMHAPTALYVRALFEVGFSTVYSQRVDDLASDNY